MPIQADREIKANRLGCLLIDIAIPTDRDTSIKVTEKLSKYKDLEIEVKRMWEMKAITMPVVIEALGRLKNGMDKYIQTISHCLQRSTR